MNYFKCKWIHNSPDDPVWLYSELDTERYETRKVEIFADGSIGYASSTEETQNTRLGELPVPRLEEIALDPEFEPEEITKEEFERVWSQRKTS